MIVSFISKRHIYYFSQIWLRKRLFPLTSMKKYAMKFVYSLLFHAYNSHKKKY